MGAVLVVGGGMDICGGMLVTCAAGGEAKEPARGGGGMLEGVDCVCVGAVGTAPGCGAGGPLLSWYPWAWVVRVGGGGCGLATEPVGAGTAAAPGRAAGYGLEAAADVIAPSPVVGVGVYAVCGVTPSALDGVMGASL